jgi:peptidyl-prolyl cis-trans isomerase C
LSSPNGVFFWGLIVLVLLSGLLAPMQMRAGQDPSTGIELRIIVVGSQAEAEQLLQKLQTGADFVALARQNSIDPSAPDGGSVGRVDPQTMRTELRDALNGALPGQIKGPVKIPTGYAILKVEGANATAGAPPVSTSVSTPTPATPVVSSGQGMSPTALLALAGRGKIAYPPDVSGAVEVEVAFRNLPKPADWDRNLHSVCETRKQTLALAVDHLKQLLDPKDPESYAATRPEELERVRFSLAQLLAYQGEMESAIQQWLEAYKFAATHSPKMLPELEEVLGTAYLH